MSVWNGWLQPPPPTQTPDDWSNSASGAQTMLAALLKYASAIFVLLLFALVMLLTACATPSLPATLPANPQPPRLSEPLPTVPYSQRALELINSWRQRATGM
jgi:hypothetical protein